MADLGMLFKRVDEGLSRQANQSLAEVNLTLSQANVLYLIDEQGGSDGMSLREIEHHVGMSQPTVTGLVKRLIAKGYVTSSIDEQDRRQRNVRLTKVGKDVVESSRASRNEAEAILARGFSSKERQQLEDYLQRILKNVG